MARGRLKEFITLSPNAGRESVMASTYNSIAAPRALIELIDDEGEWFVRVVENGRETVSTFDMESFANVYAEEQRLKLGVKFVRRV
jgi:hypothetical protein